MKRDAGDVDRSNEPGLIVLSMYDYNIRWCCINSNKIMGQSQPLFRGIFRGCGYFWNRNQQPFQAGDFRPPEIFSFSNSRNARNITVDKGKTVMCTSRWALLLGFSA